MPKLLLPIVLIGTIAGAQERVLTPQKLRIEYLVNPIGIEETHPRLTWVVESARRGARQIAYRILVASTPERLAQDRGDLWDSGKVASDQTVNIAYAGLPLHSRERCYSKVQVWDENGRASPWSSIASWSMGLLAPADWTARWISYRDRSPLHTSRDRLYLPPARYFRKAFETRTRVRRAMLYVSALGIFDAYVNGQRVSDAMFAPGWSDYRKRAYYRSYDITSLVHAGGNAVGIVLADGWYAGYVGFAFGSGLGPNKAGRYLYGKTPALLAQIELEGQDGSRQIVGSDPAWRVGQGALREADILMGETYDARAEPAGWNRAAFDDSKWDAAIPAEENGQWPAPFTDKARTREVDLGFAPPRRLQAYPGPPVRPIEELRPTHIAEPAPGVYIFHMGQNFSGVARLKVKGPAGAAVRLRFGEMLYPDGRLMTENLRKARATDTYILRGDPAGETYTPRFTYHGFQYVEVSGYPTKPGLDAVTGVVVHSDTPLTSNFASSSEMANKLFSNIRWTQLSNFVELPTDCPQRDERMGWMGDAQIYARTATYNADTAAFYTKWLDDVEEAQRDNGAFTDYAPYPMQVGSHNVAYGTAWMDAGIIVPYTVYKAYGDRRVIERHYPAMQRFMDFRRGLSPDFRGSEATNDWGDWLAIGSKTPIRYIDAIYFAYTAKLMAEMAGTIHRDADADTYRKLYEKIRDVFRGDYVEPGCALKVNTQTAYALALFAGLMPDDCSRPAADRLAGLIAANNGRMATGFLGTYPLLPVLSENGHHDLAMSLFESREFPSWGYEIANGATTIWERWNSYTREEGIHEPSMNSFSHYAFGAIGEWMFRTLAGIDTDGAGFANIVIHPRPGDMSWVKAEYESIHGKIVSSWKQAGQRFDLDVTVPANVRATVFMPVSERDSITEGGKPIASVDQIRFVRQEGDRVVLSVPSGHYQFSGPAR